jgi:predicted PurR-regulated permease PerM
MLAVGVLGISMADNILRPLLLSGRTAVSGLVIFLGLLGGVAAFGFIGLVLGPIILVITGNLIGMFARPESIEAPVPEPEETDDKPEVVVSGRGLRMP